MPIDFAYSLTKHLRYIKVENHIDNAARYMSKPLVTAMNQTWVNIIHSFLVIYTDGKHPPPPPPPAVEQSFV